MDIGKLEFECQFSNHKRITGHNDLFFVFFIAS